MQYFRSPGRQPSRDAANEVLVDRLGDPAGINARVGLASTGEEHYEVHPTVPGQQGLGFLLGQGGRASHGLLQDPAGKVPSLRLEVHGRATRMHKAVATIGTDGSIVSQAEEVLDVLDAAARPTEPFRKHELRALPVPDRVVLNIFAVGDGEAALTRPLFGVSGFRILAAPLPTRFRSMAHMPATTDGGVTCAVQNLIVLRNYLHVQIEIHKPGARLKGLDIRCPYSVAHAQWWTWKPARASAGVAAHKDGTISLVARKPSAPIHSPALMDIFGAAFAHEGHAITLLLADLPDFPSSTGRGGGRQGVSDCASRPFRRRQHL